MSDLDLVKRFRDIDSGKIKIAEKENALFELKQRIQTDIFVYDYYTPGPDIPEHRRNLEFVDTCIDKFVKKILTSDDMEKINILNRKYKRIV